MTALDLASLSVDEIAALLREAVSANDVELAVYLEGEIDRALGLSWRSSPLAMARHFGALEPMPHTELLSQKFVEAVEGTNIRQIWNLPARHGKSAIGSNWGPLWELERNPTTKMALTSYGDNLASENAVIIRTLLAEYADDLQVRLQRDRRRSDRFVTEQGGGIIAAGVDSTLTGFGAHGLICLVGSTQVATPQGTRPIDTIARGDMVYGYDHASGIAVERRVGAVKSSTRSDIVEVICRSGRRIRCTSDHPIFVEGHGYIEAGLVEVGAQVRSLGRYGLPGLRQGVPASRLRRSEVEATRSDDVLLRTCVPCRHTETGTAMQGLRDGRGEEGGDLLLALCASPHGQPEASASDPVPGMHFDVHAKNVTADLLLTDVRQQGTRQTDARLRQLALQSGEQLHMAVHADAPSHPRTGRERLHRVPTDNWSATDPSSGRGPGRQSAREPRHTLHTLPYAAPQVGYDTVSMVRRVRTTGERVYDVAVEGTHNLFAEGVLVHNCDDPFKNWQEAHSPARRLAIWNWYRAVARLRLEQSPQMRDEGRKPWVIVIQCMTGDTSVLMGDGTEKPLRDIQPGDTVATYENGRVTTAAVRNWANQGPDSVLSIRMKSGTVVRANARHPFLVSQDGVEIWQRTDMLRKGSRILRVTGGNGAGSLAPPMVATSPPGARECACPITTRRAGPTGYVHHLSIPTRGALPISAIATASTRSTLIGCSRSRAASAPSASSRRLGTIPAHTGTGNSASTTVTTPDACAAYSAMTATSSSVMAAQKRHCEPLLPTCVIELDEVIEIIPCGIEDVYDLQVEHTENFIADGLVSHNTRWHEEDLTGMLLAANQTGDGAEWDLVCLPAIAEDNDLLGRKRGEPLAPRLFDLEALEARATDLGSYLAAGMEQQRPAPEEGGEIKRGWWRWESVMPTKFDESLTSWDMKMKDKESGDFVVGQAWGRTGSDFWCFDQLRGQFNLVTTKTAIILMAVRHPEIPRHIVENTGNGPEVIDELERPQKDYEVSEETRSLLGITDDEVPKVNGMFRRGLPGLIPQNVKFDKVARVRAQSGLIEAGNVHLPEGRDWAVSLVNESAAFPNAAHDDQVDALSQGLLKLRELRAATSSGRQMAARKLPSGLPGRRELTPTPFGRR